jgi:hypothetical protein
MRVDQAKDKFSLLRSRMANLSDTVLTFDKDTKVDAHAAILRLHSPLLAQILQLARPAAVAAARNANAATTAAATLALVQDSSCCT